MLYILDEPSIGLHQRDNDKLLAHAERLRDMGNTVIVVEHDEETIRAADYVVDIGPGRRRARRRDRRRRARAEVMRRTRSITGAYLSGRSRIAVPRPAAHDAGGSACTARAEHNLKNIDVELPLGMFVCVTGVCGSGKSSLVNDVILKALRATALQRRRGSKPRRAPARVARASTQIDKVIDIDQSPIGRTPRSNPATYTRLFDHIRELFATTPDAKARGYKPGRFWFNVKGGRCEACEGDGTIRLEMDFLADV